MIWGDLVRLVVVGLLFSNGRGGGGGAGPAVPAGPFPSTKPEDLPPWPTGWCPDLPPPPEVVARSWALLPTLWARGEGTRTAEMTGGRWITYVAATVDGQKAVAAYRTTDCEPVAPVSPGVAPAPASPGVQLEQQADALAKALLGSAVTVNEALKLRGYKKADMLLYQDFQQRAGLQADGFPGAVTMLKLEQVLKDGGYSVAPVKVYPWKAGGAYDGVNAPTPAEWEGVQVPPGSPIAPARPAPVVTPPGPPPIVPVSSPAAPLTARWAVRTAVDVQHALNAIGYGPLAEDGKIGPLTTKAVLVYQSEHPPLAVDGKPGPLTMAALTQSIQTNEHRPGGPSPGVVVPVLSPSTVFNTAPPGPPVNTPTQVQHALNSLGYKGKDGRALTEDGKLGANSQYAILAFQKEHPPLAQDSVAGPQTKSALSLALGRLA